MYICILIHIIYLNLLQSVYHKQAQQQSKNTHHVSACNRVFAARFLKTSLPSNGSTDLALAYLVVREALINSKAERFLYSVISSMRTETRDVRPHLVGRRPVESNQGVTN